MRKGATPIGEGPADLHKHRKHFEEDHTYAVPNNCNASYIKGLQKSVETLSTQVNCEKKCKRKFQNNYDKLQTLVHELNLESVSESAHLDIIEKASRISSTILQSLVKKSKTDSVTSHPGEAYPPEIREFSLSLHNISPAAYR